jgi:hypothetical protein
MHQLSDQFFLEGAGFAASFDASGFAVVLAPFSAGLSADGVAAGEIPVGAAPGCEAGVSAGVTGATGACSAGPTPSPNERLSNNPGIENRNAIKKNTIAAVMVIFAKTV